MDNCLQLFLVWGDVYLVHGNVERHLWGIGWCIVEEGICYQHLITRVLLESVIIVLQVEQHSLEVGWSICQVLLLDLLEVLVVTLNSESMAENISVEPFYT